MSTIKSFAKEILRISERNLEDLSTTNIIHSELNLLVNDTNELALEFEVVGQTFLLTESGIFTFDEFGQPYTPRPEFRRTLEGYLSWRLAALRKFNL